MSFRLLSCFLLISLAIAAQSIPLNCDDVAVREVVPLPTATPVSVRSAAVGVLYSPATRSSLGWRWDWEWNGCRHALDTLGVDYKILSPEELDGWNGRVLILPNVRNLSAETVATIRAKEVKVLATYMSSYRSDSNEPWPGNNFALSQELGVDFQGWVGSGERAERLLLSKSLGGGELPLGRGYTMLVNPRDGAQVLASWAGGDAAIVETSRGIYVGEDLFCPENSDSKPVLELVNVLLNRLETNVATSPDRMTPSEMPEPPATSLTKSGRSVKVGLGRLETESLLRARESLTIDGESKQKFHRWLPGTAVVATGQPYVEVLRLRENGTYRWSAYRGTLKITEDGTMINVLDFEEYLAGVVPGEVPSYFPEESLKAMAVVARTYGLSHLGRHQEYDVCDTVHCQVYQGLGQESEPTNRAVTVTSGELLTYEGQPVNALFHAVCGGTTAASNEAWPSGVGKPYLSSRDDGTYCAHSGRYRWSATYSQDELVQTFRTALEATKGSEFKGLSAVLSLTVEERTASGRVRVLSIQSPESTYRVEGDAIRWLFSGGKISTAGLQSTLFELEKAEDGYLIKGGGWGHGVGLCQQGSSGRADAGQSYQDILSHYYPETTLLGLQEWERRTAETFVQPSSTVH
jgi:stage II sporulation protein D (peptidoglycan lytic transglycosylase)